MIKSKNPLLASMPKVPQRSDWTAVGVGRGIFMEEEIWKDIVGYEGFYQVSNYGRFRSLDRLINGRWHPYPILGCNIKPVIKTTGYSQVGLQKNGKQKVVLAHILVAKHFILNPFNKKCVNHIDCNKTNNHFSNLEWVTYKENSMHMVKMGRCNPPIEFMLPHTKLSDVQVLEIMNRLNGGEKGCNLSKEYKVSQQTICDIKNNRSRKRLFV